MFFRNEVTFTPDEILLYLRKSRFDDPLQSVEEVLEKHEMMLDDLSERMFGGKVPQENRFREIVSGETIQSRPEVQRVLRTMESPKYRAILIVDVQRLSRGDLEDAGRLIKLLRFTGTFVITPQKIYDLQDEYDRDAFERELKRGNEYLEYTKKIMGNGRLLSVSQGNFIGSIAPYGYNKAFITEGKKRIPTLEINEEETAVVRMIYNLYVNEDMGVTNISHYLNSIGIIPRNSERWTQHAIRDILRNEHYIGKVRWNRRRTVVVVENGEITKTRPDSKEGNYYVFDGIHSPIISEELFYAAQDKHGRNHRSKPKTKMRNALATLIFCQCGKAMSYRTHKDREGNERCAPRLLCNNQAYCHTTSVIYDEMIDKVADVLKQCIENFEVNLRSNNDDVLENHRNLIKHLENKLEELSKKEINLWEKYTEEGMPKEIFNQLIQKVQSEKESIKESLANARKNAPDPTNYEEKIHMFQEALDALKDPDVSVENKNALLKSCIKRIDYKRGQARRMTKEDAEKNGISLRVGSKWTDEPFEIDVKLNV